MKKTIAEFLAALKKVRLHDDEWHLVRKNLGLSVRPRPLERHNLRMNTDQFIGLCRKVKLSPAERARSKEHILDVIGLRSHSWWVRSFKGLTSLVASLLIVTIVGSGIGYAAEGAMPGEMLYPIKIHISEPLQAQLLMSPEKQAMFEAELTERRLSETKMLLREKKLSRKHAMMLAEHLKKHTRGAIEKSNELLKAEKTHVALSIGMELESSLKAHAELLRNSPAREEETPELLDAIEVARVEAEEVSIASTMDALNEEEALATANDIAQARAENVIDSAYSGHDLTSPPKLEEAEAFLAQSKEATTPGAALRLSRKALRNAKEAFVLETANEDASLATAMEHSRDQEASLETTAELPSGDSAPAFMMMAVEPAPAGKAFPAFMPPTEYEEKDWKHDEDMIFETNVRMNMARHKLHDLEDVMHERSEKLLPHEEMETIMIENRMEGAKQLLDIAEGHQVEGFEEDALDASEMALKYAHKAKKEMERMVEGR